MEPNKTIRYEARTLDWWLGRLTDPTNFWIGVYNPDDDMYPDYPNPVLHRVMQSPRSPWQTRPTEGSK